MSTTMSNFVVLVDDGLRQTSSGYLRESQAWESFWSEIAAQPDDGVEITGLDKTKALASRTGLDRHGVRWYTHLIKEAV